MAKFTQDNLEIAHFASQYHFDFKKKGKCDYIRSGRRRQLDHCSHVGLCEPFSGKHLPSGLLSLPFLNCLVGLFTEYSIGALLKRIGNFV